MIKRGFIALFIIASFACSKQEDPFDPFAQFEIDITAINEYLNANNLTAEVDDSGVRYIIDNVGNGVAPKIGERVFVNYEVFLFDGTFIDTSIEQTARDNNAFNSQRAYVPFEFVIGGGTVIQGFDLGTRLLTEGGSGTFLIPSVLAYENRGTANIPPNASLLFTIELVEIEN